jgi:4-hydroxyphenylpyruvate dioxygenase-like putative hemolysin
VRTRRPGPFANAIWHEHVEEEVEVQHPAIGGNGHGELSWSDDEEDTHAYDDAFGQLDEEPEDIEAA